MSSKFKNRFPSRRTDERQFGSAQGPPPGKVLATAPALTRVLSGIAVIGFLALVVFGLAACSVERPDYVQKTASAVVDAPAVKTDSGPVHVVGVVDCTASVSDIETGFVGATRDATKFAGSVAGSEVKFDVLTGNSGADIGWRVHERFVADESLVSDELIEGDLLRRAEDAAKSAGPKLVKACQSSRRDRSGSDVLGATLIAARELSSGVTAEQMPVFALLSDARHWMPGDWFSLVSSPKSTDRPAQVVSRLKSEGRLPDFPAGTRVVVVGGGRSTDLTSEQVVRIEQIWRAIFRASGAQIYHWGPRFVPPGTVTK